MDIATFLTDVEVFESLGKKATEQLARRAEEQCFKHGTTIIQRGEAGDCMYVIIEGHALVPVFDQDGNEQFVAQLGPKQVFGEMALLTGEPRSADVIAATDCRTLCLRREVIDELIAERNDFAQLLTTILGERLVKSGTIRKIGKYNLAGELGRGGMSIVYEGFHPVLERAVAIKMLSHQLAVRPTFRERFENEARLISRLRHPHIVEVFDTESAYATFFIVMERLRGMSLEATIEARTRVAPDRVRDVLRQLASALKEAHDQGVVHRDVKPSNIMVSTAGHVKLMDFGLALDIGERDDPETGKMSGTPLYMAPEQIRGGVIDGRTDVYALGVMAYEMLTGQPPFLGRLYEVLDDHEHTPIPSPRKEIVDVPDDLEEFVHRAAAKEPGDRFQTCDEILGFLAAPKPFEKLSVRTLTMVYDAAQEAAVDDLVRHCQERAERIANLEIH